MLSDCVLCLIVRRASKFVAVLRVESFGVACTTDLAVGNVTRVESKNESVCLIATVALTCTHLADALAPQQRR